MIRRYFIAGLLVWLPIWVTYFIIKFIVDLMDRSIAFLPAKYHPEQLIGFSVPGVGLVLTLLIIFLTGLLMTNFVGHRIVAGWESLVSKIPVIRSIHSAVKQVAHSLLQPTGNAFQKAVLVEYPRLGVWSIGFLTSEEYDGIPGQTDTITVFIPTTPNPTSGFLTFVSRESVKELEISVEEALRMVISIGVVLPGNRHLVK